MHTYCPLLPLSVLVASIMPWMQYLKNSVLRHVGNRYAVGLWQDTRNLSESDVSTNIMVLPREIYDANGNRRDNVATSATGYSITMKLSSTISMIAVLPDAHAPDAAVGLRTTTAMWLSACLVMIRLSSNE